MAPQDAATVSEASGYGLLASVLANRRIDFDKFLIYYNEQENDQGLSCWQQVLRNNKIFTDPDPSNNGCGSATDGDLDAAYAVLLAGQKWHDPLYTERGIKLCAAIWKWSITAETRVTNLGDWCKDKDGKEADKFYWVSRPSDYMLTHFQLFSEVDTQRSKQWISVIEASVQVLQQQLALHPETGLLADFLVYNKSEKRFKPSKGKILERDSDGDFGYNACRVPWRLAIWYKQTHDQRLLPLLQAQQRFFEGQEPISAGYRLNGQPLETYTNICFLAPVLCLLKVMGSKRIQHIEKAIQRERTAGRATYFGESIELIVELQLQQL
ncbi:hypothetical protein WJX77_010658 [Trebouxia sp. C0004]